MSTATQKAAKRQASQPSTRKRKLDDTSDLPTPSTLPEGLQSISAARSSSATPPEPRSATAETVRDVTLWESISLNLDVEPLEQLVGRLNKELAQKKVKSSNVVTSDGAATPLSGDPNLTMATTAPPPTPAPQQQNVAPLGVTDTTTTVERPQTGDRKRFNTLAAIREHGRANHFVERIVDFPDNVLQIIFKKLLTQTPDICPFYSEKFEEIASAFSDKELRVMKEHRPPLKLSKKKQNIDLRVSGVCRLFYAIASTVYYSENIFVFNDARSCLWFLEKIGEMKTSYLRKVVFNVSSGFFLSMKHRDCEDVSEEKRWYNIFRFLAYRQRFDTCVVRFFGLNNLQQRGDLKDTEKKDMTKARLDLVAILSDFRGIQWARIDNDRCEFLGWSERYEIAQTMVISKPTWRI